MATARSMRPGGFSCQAAIKQNATEEPSVPATRVSSFGLGPRAMGRLDEVDESDSPRRRRSRDLLLSDYID
jgi:hypothetical protein